MGPTYKGKKGKEDKGWRGGELIGKGTGEGKRGRRERRGSLGRAKKRREGGMEGISLPHGRLKTLAALITLWRGSADGWTAICYMRYMRGGGCIC